MRCCCRVKVEMHPLPAAESCVNYTVNQKNVATAGTGETATEQVQVQTELPPSRCRYRRNCYGAGAGIQAKLLRSRCKYRRNCYGAGASTGEAATEQVQVQAKLLRSRCNNSEGTIMYYLKQSSRSCRQIQEYFASRKN